MKILMLVTWYSPKDAPVLSAGVFHYEQAMALQAHCETALFFPYDTQLDSRFSRSQEHGLLTYRCKPLYPSGNRIRRLLGKLSCCVALYRVYKDFKPDVIHAHCGLPAGKLALTFKKLFKLPVIVTEHCPVEYMGLDDPLRQEAYRQVYSNADANICVSGNLKSQLEQTLGDHRFQVIYNGVEDPLPLVQTDRTYQVENSLNCGIVGGFYSKDVKGYQHLLPAIAQLKAQNVNITLHICGSGEYQSYYQDLARELNITDNCIFYGQCDKPKLYSIMAQMDFCISASLFESAGVSVTEAMLLGKPLVVTRSGGANSLVNEQTAIVVDCGSTEALVDGIRQLQHSLSQFDPAQIRAYAQRHFLMEQVCSQHMALYQTLSE